MKKNPKIFLQHILESIKEIARHIKHFSKEKFMKDVKTQDAVMRRIEIIGEATKNLPLYFKRNNPRVAWKEIAGMRDKLIHEYFGVDRDLVWKVAKNDIQKLKKQILELVKNYKEE